MEKLLGERESQIWEFPKFPKFDDSITKYDNITVYEDHHGAGTLMNADSFSFTTENDDIWLLPSESYLKVEVVVRKADGTNYRWATVPAVAADAQANPPVVAAAAVPADNVNISDNGYNIFSDARLYLGDQEIERIDYLGMSTLLTSLMEIDKRYEMKNSKHTELSFFIASGARQTYLRKVGGVLHLLLPVKKMFSFFNENNHVFRGTKFRVSLNLNSSDNLIVRGAAAAVGEVKVRNMKWIVPYVEPSLDVMARLETQLAKSASYKMRWNAKTVYKYQPPKHIDVRIPLASSVHKPKRVFVILQHAENQNNQSFYPLEFDNLELESCFVEVNSIRFPDKPLEFNFQTHDYTELYNNFLAACDERNAYVDYETFASTYPILHFDISKHPVNLYENTNFPTITLYLKFNHALAADYIAWVIIENEREATLNLDNKRMLVIR